MRKITVLLCVCMALFLAEACKNDQKEKVLTREVTFKKEGELKLLKAENDSIVAQLDIEIANNDYEIQTGLMYRKSMQDNRGMLFVFEYEQPRSFYMKNTEFSLDIIFINANKEIISIQKNTKPGDLTSLPSGAPALYVLEVNAGMSDRWKLEAGDKIEWSSNQ